MVALVCSAGGLDALTTVLGGLPAGLPAAVVVQQHLGAGSTLAPLLKRRTGLPAEWALDRGSIRPGDVLVCPPQHSIELLAGGRYRLRPATGRARSLVHDALFASLADAYGGRGVAVVLTGMGSDGAAGTAIVLKAGGITLAQSEASAEWPSMPRAAAAAGALLIFPLDHVAGVLAGIARGEPLPRTDGASPGYRRGGRLCRRPGAVARAAAGPARRPAGAVLVVLHIPSTGGRALPRILDCSGPLPAATAVDGERIERGHVYVAPPDRHLLVVKDEVRLSRGLRQNGFRPAADPLFRSAALHAGTRVTAVVLSGSLDDAALGSATVERLGGRVVVQDPQTPTTTVCRGGPSPSPGGRSSSPRRP